MTKKVLDPEAYIESAFLDEEFEPEAEGRNQAPAAKVEAKAAVSVEVPQRDGEMKPKRSSVVEAVRAATELKTKKPAVQPRPVEEKPTFVQTTKSRKVGLNAPRPRRRKKPLSKTVITEDLESAIKQAPKNLKFLATLFDDSVTEKYYTKKFKEPREEFIRRLIDPELNLEETARLLGVCPATVRRYTNRGWLDHHRTSGNQRRFRLSDIVRFVDQYGRHPD